MRFYEFAPVAKPVLKISQPQANTPPTPLPGNTPPTPTAAEPTRVYPRAWQHEWIQRYLAAKIAKDAQTVQPTELDIAKAYLRYGEARRQVDMQYAQQQKQAKTRSKQSVDPADEMSFKRTR
jgi:hypothetical protein